MITWSRFTQTEIQVGAGSGEVLRMRVTWRWLGRIFRRPPPAKVSIERPTPVEHDLINAIARAERVRWQAENQLNTGNWVEEAMRPPPVRPPRRTVHPRQKGATHGAH